MRVKYLLLFIGLGLSTVSSHAFTLTPMSTTLDPKGNGSAKSFQVENETSNRVAFQITLLTRDMDEDGKETNQPATDFFTVFPPQGIIAPGQSQTVRLVWKGQANLTNELAYRLLAEELPVNFTPETNKAQIKVLLRYIAAVYVRPKNAKPKLQVTSFTQTETNTCVMIVTNAGNAHQPLIDPVLTLTDARGQTQKIPSGQILSIAGQNILAKHTRRFVLTLPPDFKETSYQAQLTADE
jgi:fimbrial chaperone protein